MLKSSVLALVIVAQAARPTGAGKWLKTEERSKADDSKTVILMLPAEETITTWTGTQRPVLILRCQENKTDAYVVTGVAANPELGRHNEATVLLRYDKTPATTQLASEATDNKALFLKNPANHIKTMLNSKVLLFRFTPFNSAPQETTFDLTGLGAILEPLRAACGWDEAKLAAQKRKVAEAGDRIQRSKTPTKTIATIEFAERSGRVVKIEVTDAGVKTSTGEWVWCGEQERLSVGFPWFSVDGALFELADDATKLPDGNTSRFNVDMAYRLMTTACAAWEKRFPGIRER